MDFGNRTIKISIEKGVGTLARVMMHRFLSRNESSIKISRSEESSR